jgi:hypothetical protein
VLPDPVLEEAAPVPPEPPRRRVAAVVIGAMAVLAVLGVWSVFFTSGRPGSPPGSWTLRPYTGLGAWVDVYDWTGPHPTVGVQQIDAMADAGVQTVFLQTSRSTRHEDVLEPKRLDQLIDRAHARHLHVVAWYLPTFTDTGRDLRRLEAAAALEVDGLAVDIEATDVADIAQRNQRVVELSQRVRAAIDRTRRGKPRVVSAITLSPVHLDVVNPTYWPGYPWPELGTTYDAVLPMAYWTLRRGDQRDAERYVTDTVDRIRTATGMHALPVHVIGGLAEDATTPDLRGMVASVDAVHAIGGSLYDWSSSTPTQWKDLRSLRTLRAQP